MKDVLQRAALTLAILALGAVAYVAWSGEPLPTSRLFGDPSLEDAGRSIDDLPPGVSYAVGCTPGLCGSRTDVTESAAFPVSPQALFAVTRDSLLDQPNVMLLEERADALPARLVLVQRSSLLGAPEIVTIDFNWTNSEHSNSGLFLVSRQREGAWEPGGYASRVPLWLGAIERAVRDAPQRKGGE